MFLKFFILLLILILPEYAHPQSYGDLEGVVYVSNYDGDTIKFDIPNVHPLLGDNILVRVNGIDAPEIKGKCEKEKTLAVAAKKAATKILSSAKKIIIKNVQRDKYFRILGSIDADGQDLASALIKDGLAVPYDGGTKTKDWCL